MQIIREEYSKDVRSNTVTYTVHPHTGVDAVFHYKTNGYQGGDGGHGGYMTVGIEWNKIHEQGDPPSICVHKANQKPSDDLHWVAVKECSKIEITVRGDWEMECLAEGLERLAANIRNGLEKN